MTVQVVLSWREGNSEGAIEYGNEENIGNLEEGSKRGRNKLHYEQLHNLCSLLLVSGPPNQRSKNGTEMRGIWERRRQANYV